MPRTKKRGAGRKSRPVPPLQSRDELGRLFRAFYMPCESKGHADPPPLVVGSHERYVRLRYRKADGSTITLTGDCFANLLGYQTTSAVVNRLAQTIRVQKIEMWAGGGSLAAASASDEPGAVAIAFVDSDNNVDESQISKQFMDVGTPMRSAHLSVCPPVNQVLDCTRQNRWVMCHISGPTGTIIDVTLEWNWYQRGIVGPYTLTSVTTNVGLSPHNAYLDNTAAGGGAGSSLCPRYGPILANDFNAYG